MTIGLISENEIRQKLRDEIAADIKKFNDSGGVIQQIPTHDSRFWDRVNDSVNYYNRRTEGT